MVKKEKKAESIDLIKEKISQAEIVIATDYRGLTVAEISGIRQKLRPQGAEYRVVKNTLAIFAATATGNPKLSDLLKGPTALAFGYDDVVQPAKTLMDYQRSLEGKMRIKGGVLADSLLTAEDVAALAKLPPREELIGKVLSLAQSPIYRLLIVLNGNLQGLLGLLQARVQQLEGE